MGPAGSLTLLLAALLVTAQALAAGAQPAQRVFVTLEGEDAVAAVDPVSLRVLTVTVVGPRPHNMAATGRYLLVALQGGQEAVVFDTTRPREVRKIALGAVPHDVDASAEGGRGYVLSAAGVLTLIGLPAGGVARRMALGGRPHNLLTVDDGVWITDIASPSVTIVDAQTGERTGSVRLAAAGHDLARRPGTDEIWITPWTGNGIMIADTRTRRAAAVVSVGTGPQHLAFTPDGREVWITETTSGTVFIVDAARRQVAGALRLGARPHHVAVDDRRAYMAAGPSDLIAIDTRARGIVARVRVGANPHDVVIY